MNNCPKCGNPLQPGQTSCPICGTSINVAPIQAVAPDAPVVEQAQVTPPSGENIQPVQATPVAPVQPIQAEVPVQPVAPTAQPVQAQQQVVAEPVQPVVTPIAEPAAPIAPVASVEPAPAAPVVEPISQPVAEPTPVVEQTTVAQEVATAPVVEQTATPTEVAPVAEPVPAENIANVVDAMSLPNLEVLEAKMDQTINPTTTKKTGFKNKPVIIVGLIAVLLIIGSGVSIALKGNKPVTPTGPKTPEVVTSNLYSNGYKLEMPQSWIILEDGKDTLVNNDSDSLMIKLFNINSSYDTISASTFEEYFESSEYYKNIKVETINLTTEKRVVKVSAKYESEEKYYVEYYYIEGNTNLTYGLTAVYYTEESFNDNKDTVKSIVDSLSYSDDSIKALNTKTKYAYIISAGEKVFNDYYRGIEDPNASEEEEEYNEDFIDEENNSEEYEEYSEYEE